MNDVMVVAQETASRILRAKSFYFLLACVIVLIASTRLYGTLSAGMTDVYTLDMGYALMHLIGLLCALTVCFDLPRELRERTAVAVLTKPLGRDRYLVGKWLGTCAVALVAIGITTGGLAWIVMEAGGFRPVLEIVKGGALELVSAVELIAVAALLSLFLSEWVAAVGVVVIMWLGHLLSGLVHTGGESAGMVLRAASWILPQGAANHLPGPVVREATIAPLYLGLAALLGIAYAVAVLTLASLVFRQKDVG